MSVHFVHDKYGRLGLHENTGTPAWKDSLARLQLDMAQLGITSRRSAQC